MATSQWAKRQKMRVAARKHQAKRPRPSKVDDSDKCSDKQAEAEKDLAKDPAKDPGKDPKMDTEATTWCVEIIPGSVVSNKMQDKDQTAATKRQKPRRHYRGQWVAQDSPGEHYVWYAILTIIQNWDSKQKEQAGRRYKRVLEDPVTPRLATRTRVFPAVQHLTPIVFHSRAADSDNELQAKLLRLAEDTPAHPKADTFANWIIKGGCEVGEPFMSRYYEMFFWPRNWDLCPQGMGKKM
ncbi:hypothetical protein BDD12DRAFT_891492 [Trichophaea hybrida]|nr:hypothetical protein BDD12DRAFT_891492 [Trichophaea hybrida]